MSVVDLYALEARYNSGKTDYRSALNAVNFGRGEQPTQRAAQMNVDLQTLLLQMSDMLSLNSKEQFQLLGASDSLQGEYQQLTDSSVIATMHKSHYMAWTLGATVLFFLVMRGLIPEIKQD